jgi:hypothetical protein
MNATFSAPGPQPAQIIDLCVTGLPVGAIAERLRMRQPQVSKHRACRARPARAGPSVAQRIYGLRAEGPRS